MIGTLIDYLLTGCISYLANEREPWKLLKLGIMEILILNASEDSQRLTGVAMENHSPTIKGECIALALNQMLSLNLLDFSRSRDK